MKNKMLQGKAAQDTQMLTIAGLMALALIIMAVLQPGDYIT